MPAAIATDGTRDLFASHRQPAWHGLGNVFAEEVTDHTKMLELAGLDNWDVRLAPMAVPAGVDYLINPGFHVLADIGSQTIGLGTVGSRYNIIQNEEAFSFLQSLRDGASWETAGALKDGRVVFGSLTFERDFVLDSEGVADTIKTYLLVTNSHDGSTNLFGGVTPTRVVCQNTLNVAVGNLRNTFKIRHTASAKDKMLAEAALWRHANTYMDAFETEAAELYATTVTDKQWNKVLEGLFPKPDNDSKAAVTRWETKVDMYNQAWNGAPNAGIRNTAWGVANALTEANQWGRNIQNTDNGEENFWAAGSGYDPVTNSFRQKAFAIAGSL